MSVEDFGVNLYVLQLIFGGVDIPAKFIAVLSMNHLGRHITQAGALLLAGGAILAITFVPSGEKPGLSQSPLKAAQRVRGQHRLPPTGKWAAWDLNSAGSAPNSLCYLEQVPETL